jgi:hypothetical protein
MLPIPPNPSAYLPWCWQKHPLLTIRMPVFRPQLHCPRSFTQQPCGLPASW